MSGPKSRTSWATASCWMASWTSGSLGTLDVKFWRRCQKPSKPCKFGLKIPELRHDVVWKFHATKPRFLVYMDICWGVSLKGVESLSPSKTKDLWCGNLIPRHNLILESNLGMWFILLRFAIESLRVPKSQICDVIFQDRVTLAGFANQTASHELGTTSPHPGSLLVSCGSWNLDSRLKTYLD